MRATIMTPVAEITGLPASWPEIARAEETHSER